MGGGILGTLFAGLFWLLLLALLVAVVAWIFNQTQRR
jgi:cbb3-type cytochrome oxidase subunit 3